MASVGGDDRDGDLVLVSAPGKVLLTGGYLVLEQPNEGVVLTVSSRFYTLVQRRPSPALPGDGTTAGADGIGDGSAVAVRVWSPQFRRAQTYAYRSTDGAAAILDPIACVNEHGEPIEYAASIFTETAILGVMGTARAVLGDAAWRDAVGGGLEVTIAGDNAFYSQRATLEEQQLSATADNLAALPHFLPLPLEGGLLKTGLGSSAALVSSMVGALMAVLGLIDLPEVREAGHPGLAAAHNLAQVCHCAAQGKVGSGFDISSACWGSHAYRRFSKAILNSVLEQDLGAADGADLATLVGLPLGTESPFDSGVRLFALPPGLQLLVGDVALGSNTPVMVRQVLAWRREDPASGDIWSALNAANNRVSAGLERLSDLAAKAGSGPAYDAALEAVAQCEGDKWASMEGDESADGVTREVAGLLAQVHADYGQVRSLLRAMSAASEVPIEPQEQTALLDATMAIPGVVLAGVPGAGGFDAVAVVVVGEAAAAAVEAMWSAWSDASVCRLNVGEDGSGLVRHVAGAVDLPPAPPHPVAKY